MKASELMGVLPNVINEISLITGLKVDDQNAEPFARLVSKFLLVHYGQLTASEITTAFSLNAAGDLPGMTANKFTEKVEFFSQFLTIEHIGSVLYRYWQRRGELAKKLREQKGLELPEPKLTPEQIEMDEKQFANEYFRKYLHQEFSSVSLEYAHGVYDILDRWKMIALTVEQKRAYFNKAQEIRNNEISAPALSWDERKENNKLVGAYLNNQVPASEQEMVRQYAKRIALLELFKAWKDEKRIKIFNI